jgi:hypothetical protein
MGDTVPAVSLDIHEAGMKKPTPPPFVIDLPPLAAIERGIVERIESLLDSGELKDRGRGLRNLVKEVRASLRPRLLRSKGKP